MWLLGPNVAAHLLERYAILDNTRTVEFGKWFDPLEAGLLERPFVWGNVGVPRTPSDACDLSHPENTASEVDIDNLA